MKIMTVRTLFYLSYIVLIPLGLLLQHFHYFAELYWAFLLSNSWWGFMTFAPTMLYSIITLLLALFVIFEAIRPEIQQYFV